MPEKSNSSHLEKHVKETIATYDQIADSYHLVATKEHKAWIEESMGLFVNDLEVVNDLQGKRVLVAGCGEGRDSMYLTTLGMTVDSFDLSKSMLAIAKKNDPQGNYFQHDLREVESIPGFYDGIWASACLYHLTKAEFVDCLEGIRKKLKPGGVLFGNFKLGDGEGFIEVPRSGYPGDEVAREKLRGRRFYSFYRVDELEQLFSRFEILRCRKDILKEGDGAVEFWLRKS